jgi:hypothetical protein
MLDAKDQMRCLVFCMERTMFEVVVEELLVKNCLYAKAISN